MREMSLSNSPVMFTMKVSFPSGMASFRSSKMALAVVTPDVKLTTALELKKSLSTEVLVTCEVKIIHVYTEARNSW